MAYEFDDRVISVDIGRHERTSPGRDLDLGTVSGADISKLLFQGFCRSREDCAQAGYVSVYGGLKNQIRFHFCS